MKVGKYITALVVIFYSFLGVYSVPSTSMVQAAEPPIEWVVEPTINADGSYHWKANKIFKYWYNYKSEDSSELDMDNLYFNFAHPGNNFTTETEKFDVKKFFDGIGKYYIFFYFEKPADVTDEMVYNGSIEVVDKPDYIAINEELPMEVIKVNGKSYIKINTILYPILAQADVTHVDGRVYGIPLPLELYIPIVLPITS